MKSLGFALITSLFLCAAVEACPLTEQVYVQPAAVRVQSFSAGYGYGVQSLRVQSFSSGYDVAPAFVAPRQVILRQSFRSGFRGGFGFGRSSITIRERGFGGGRSAIIIRR